MNEPLTFASVVFEAELPLLEVQAKSLARHLDPDCVARVIVLDNTALGVGAAQTKRLQRAYGTLADRVTYLRVPTLANVRGAGGWRSQQVAKLVVSRQIDTPKYVVLDAKNHLVRSADSNTFVGNDGRSHVGLHSYQSHPLRESLASTAAFLGANEAEIASIVDHFPITATPFVFDTALVGQTIAYVEKLARKQFAEAFEEAKLLEFFTYSSWVKLHGPGLEAVFDQVPIQSPTVWPKGGSLEGLTKTIEAAMALDAPFFAVHRQVLADAEPDLELALADWWHSRGLFESPRAATALLRRFRRGYLPSMLLARANERLGRLGVRLGPSEHAEQHR